MSNFQNVLFIDIETVSCAESYEGLSPRLQSLWLHKAGYLGGKEEEDKKGLFFKKGGIFAEFGKVIVISVGYVRKNDSGRLSLHVKNFSNDDERRLLMGFKDFLEGLSQRGMQFCGHNIKEFDIPYLCRRMLVQGIRLPRLIDVTGKKPWEVNHIDTMELWKFGDRKNYTSLELLAALFDLPSSKEDMQGSEVNSYYYHRKDLPAIVRYCAKDVATTALLYGKLRGLPSIAPEDIFLDHKGEEKPKPVLPLLQ